MDLDDFSEYFAMAYIAKRDKASFMKANNITYFNHINYLLLMNYVINERGFCFDADLAYIKKTEKNKLPMYDVQVKLGYMRKNGLVKHISSAGYHPVLKRRFIITDRGYFVLDNYMSLFFRKKRDLSYLLKKVHIDADKLAKK